MIVFFLNKMKKTQSEPNSLKMFEKIAKKNYSNAASSAKVVAKLTMYYC